MWAQWFWSEEALLPAHSLMLPTRPAVEMPELLWPRQGAQESAKGNYVGPQGMGTVRVPPDQA